MVRSSSRGESHHTRRLRHGAHRRPLELTFDKVRLLSPTRAWCWSTCSNLILDTPSLQSIEQKQMSKKLLCNRTRSRSSVPRHKQSFFVVSRDWRLAQVNFFNLYPSSDYITTEMESHCRERAIQSTTFHFSLTNEPWIIDLCWLRCSRSVGKAGNENYKNFDFFGNGLSTEKSFAAEDCEKKKFLSK